MTTPPSTFAEAEQRLAETLPRYESRPQQQDFAQAVERSLDTERHLLAQAGCGCGKSLGYLIPAILSGKRIVVATATKALQDQISETDLPFLQEHLGVPFTYAVLKGRSNYLCQAKLADGKDITPQVSAQIAELIASDVDFDGLREQLPELNDREWSKLTTSSDGCPGKRNCPFGQQCFSERAKAAAKEADVVVVNHALYFTDLLIRTKTAGAVSLIGAHDVVIFDEAHEAADYATNAFGITITEATFASIGAEARNFGAAYSGGTRVESATAHLAGAVTGLFEVFQAGRLSLDFVVENQDVFVETIDALREVRSAVSACVILDGDTKAATRKKIIARRLETLVDKMTSIVLDDATTTVRWIETEHSQRFGDRKILKALPINVGDAYLRELLFDAAPVTLEDGEVVVPPICILASATMKTQGNFKFLARSLGIDTFDSIDVGTPFDFAKQSVLYVPSHLPKPIARNREAWQSMAIAEIGNLVRASDGRALLLFTSKADMKRAYDTLANLIDHPCYIQGEAPNGVLVERFKSEVNSVLFATKSFFTGVDIQGDALSLVVVSKLPFPVPTEPLNEARCDLIKQNGGNDFAEFTIPSMELPLQQAFGRLIRHREDTGVVAILDPRLTSEGYGRGIVRSLPDAKLVENIGDVQAFFAREAAPV